MMINVQQLSLGIAYGDMYPRQCLTDFGFGNYLWAMFLNRFFQFYVKSRVIGVNDRFVGNILLY